MTLFCWRLCRRLLMSVAADTFGNMTTNQVSDRDLVLSVIDDFFDKVDRLHQLDPATMTEEELWRYLQTEHRVSETLSMLQRNMIKSLTRASPEELGGELPDVLAEALHISREDAERRIDEAMAAT